LGLSLCPHPRNYASTFLFRLLFPSAQGFRFSEVVSLFSGLCRLPCLMRALYCVFGFIYRMCFRFSCPEVLFCPIPPVAFVGCGPAYKTPSHHRSAAKFCVLLCEQSETTHMNGVFLEKSGFYFRHSCRLRRPPADRSFLRLSHFISLIRQVF
jgi:hypothetical protein